MCAVALDAWLGYQSAVDTATVVQDRLLLGSARMIAEPISFEDGTFQQQIPPAALELFQSREADRVFYRVTTGAGQMLSGYSDMPVLTAPISGESPYFFDASMRGEPVRVVVVLQPVIGSPSTKPVTVEVAQTTRSHRQLTNRLWMQAMRQQLLILVLTAIFILFGLHQGLRPLLRLRDDVRLRKEGSLQRLSTHQIPAELKPLVDAFNDYMERLENYTHLRSAFIQNAAHQLRTPLAVLNIQISDVQRAPDKASGNVALHSVRKTLQQTTRLVNQFLLLSSVEAGLADKLAMSSQACRDIVQQALEDMAPQAHRKNIDLGFERGDGDHPITCNPTALREIAINLIDNAIRYTQAEGVVTVSLQTSQTHMSLVVEDNGPGVAQENAEKIFQRFYRVTGTDSVGSGLGLAIVKELASQCGGTVAVGAPASGATGFVIIVTFVAEPI
jgi:two-component system sensor histidine kinase TctE